MRHSFIILLILVSLLSCSQNFDKELIGLQYYPEINLLKKGLVWKYYYHSSRKDGQTKTDIRYIKKTLSGKDFISAEYNAEFKKIQSSKVSLKEDKWILKEDKRYEHRNSFKELFKESTEAIQDSIAIDWGNDQARLIQSSVEDGNGRKLITEQLQHQDIRLDNVKAHLITGVRQFIRIKDDRHVDTLFLNWIRRYEKDRGLTSSKFSNDQYTFEYRLDEIMSIREFERRADHGTHRVAYIDTLTTLDDHTEFNPCYHQEKINDYYNDRRAEFLGGKGRLRAVLKKKLISSKLGNESGFLTYRFVINCNGQAGWFVTEEAGLDYQKKEFSEDCVMHLFDILKTEPEWVPSLINKEARDAYTYITFKLKDGEIIEILP